KSKAIRYSNSINTWFSLTASPGATFTDFTFTAIGAVTLVSIFMASRTTSKSSNWNGCAGCTQTRTTIPATGLRQTLDSSAASFESDFGRGAVGTNLDWSGAASCRSESGMPG